MVLWLSGMSIDIWFDASLKIMKNIQEYFTGVAVAGWSKSP